MSFWTCDYCRKGEETNLAAAFHTCDPHALKDRIDGLEAHCRLWHREATRLAAKHGESTFYYEPGYPAPRYMELTESQKTQIAAVLAAQEAAN